MAAVGVGVRLGLGMPLPVVVFDSSLGVDVACPVLFEVAELPIVGASLFPGLEVLPCGVSGVLPAVDVL